MHPGRPTPPKEEEFLHQHLRNRRALIEESVLTVTEHQTVNCIDRFTGFRNENNMEKNIKRISADLFLDNNAYYFDESGNLVLDTDFLIEAGHVTAGEIATISSEDQNRILEEIENHIENTTCHSDGFDGCAGCSG